MVDGPEMTAVSTICAKSGLLMPTGRFMNGPGRHTSYFLLVDTALKPKSTINAMVSAASLE